MEHQSPEANRLRLELWRKLDEAPAPYREYYIRLRNQEEAGAGANFDVFTFVSAMEIARTVHMLQEDNGSSSVRITEEDCRNWLQEADVHKIIEDLHARGISVPYAELQTDGTIAAVISLLPDMLKKP